MKIYEFVKMAKSLLEVMDAHDIEPHYAKHIEIYEQYMRMKAEGHKMVYAIRWLAETYETSESTIKRIVQRFNKEL